MPVELGPKLSWAKCDMLYTVRLERLSPVKGLGGGHLTPRVLQEDLDGIREGVLRGLGLPTSAEVLGSFLELDAARIDDP